MIDVPPHVATFLARLIEGWIPPLVPKRRVTRCVWGSTDLTKMAAALEIERDRLVVTGTASRDVREIQFPGPAGEDDRVAPIRGRVHGGLHFYARNALLSNRSVQSDVPGIAFRLRGYDWRVVDPRRPAQLWVGSLAGKAPFALTGNLVVESGRRRSSGHLCLRGAEYTYYVVFAGKRAEESSFLVVDTGSANRPRLSVLRRDLVILQFVLGTMFSMDMLLGIGEHGEVVAQTGGNLGMDRAADDRDVPPIPNAFASACWSAPFFATLSVASRDRRALRLRVPIVSYLDALDGFIDVQYVNLHVATGAFARRLLREGDALPLSLVTDPSAWGAWVEEHAASIRASAISGYEERLLERVRRAARPTGVDAIRTALCRFGLAVVPDIETELGRRAAVFASGLMGHERPVDVERLVRRVQVLRTVLVALIARAVGYSGPITGWDRDEHRRLTDADPAWWSQHSPTTSPPLDHFVARDLNAWEATGLWPVFDRPEVPARGLLGRLVSFANALGPRTGDVIVGRVHPSATPTANGAETYEFKLLVKSQPTTQAVMFTTVEKEGALTVFDWTPNDLVIRNEADLGSFLKRFGNSDRVKSTIRALMLATDNVQAKGN